MGDNDEPPYPVNGLGSIYKALADGQQKLLAQGYLSMHVDIDSQGNATSVAGLNSPNDKMTQYVAAVFMLEKYKPAICNGAPCTMSFPFRIEFKKR